MYHGNAAASFAQFMSACDVPVLWSVHSSVYRLADEKFRTACLIRLSAVFSHRARRIIYVSRLSADQHEALGFAPERALVIPNGFDCQEFRWSHHARVALRNELNLGENAVLIGLIGRFHAQKDHLTFLEAAGILSMADEASHFVLAGRGVDRQNPVLAKLVERFRLNGRVHLLGERGDIPELTAGLDIATSSSCFGESFPLVIGEAMACGVPCVVTDIGNSAAIVGKTGLSVPPRNPAALAAAWSRLIAVGAEARAKLGTAARQRILENFSLDQVVRKYEALYEDAVKNALSKNTHG
jgi:glycosyltransferase involved in cell wall biosynthesis